MMGSVLGGLRDLLNGRKARIVQIGSRAASSALISLAGMIGVADPDTAAMAGVADAIAVAAFGLVLFVIDLAIHRARHGGVLKDSTKKTLTNSG